MSKSEFRIEGQYRFDRSSPVRWIVSHALRYPLYPLISILGAALSNWAYSYRQVLIGQGFDLVTSSRWGTDALLRVALTMGAVALVQGVAGLMRSFSIEFIATQTLAMYY